MPGKNFDFIERDGIFTSSYEFRIDRAVYNELQFSKTFTKQSKPNSNTDRIKSCFSNRKCSYNGLLGFLLSVIPVLKWLPKYNLQRDLLRDIAGGMTVGIMQIPQGMAYAMLTTLPPIYGLYVSFIPIIVYFIFGTSRHISLGTFAIVCLMIGDVITNMVNSRTSADSSMANTTMNGLIEQGDGLDMDAYKVQVAVTLSFVVGVVQISLGIIRLGFLTKYLSDPLISGFTTGAAFHILGSQLRNFLGLKVPHAVNSGYFSFFKLFVYFITHIKEVNVSALILGIVSTTILFLLKYLNQKYKFKFPIPAELIVVVLGCSISYSADFTGNFGTPILKNVPKGMPALTIPSFSLMKDLISQSLFIGVVAIAVNVSLVKSFAKKNNYEVDPNQELVAYGLANAVSSLFSCFPSAASLSRSVIQEALGSTQVCGFISVTIVLLALLCMAPLFEPLPNAILAAIILVALKGLFKQFIVLKHLWKISKIDAFIWFSSFLAVFCLGVGTGLAVGFIINILSVIARTSRPALHSLGSVDGTEVYKRVEKYHAKAIPGVKIFQFNGPLYFANTEHFMNVLLAQSKIEESQGDFIGDIQKCDAAGVRNNGFNCDDLRNGYKIERRDRCLIPSFCHDAITKSKHIPSSRPGYPSAENVNLIDYANLVPLHSIVLDCSLISFTDSMAVSALGNIVSEYKKSEIEVYLACCSDAMKSMLSSSGFFTVHGKERLFVTVHDAVLHCTSATSLRARLVKQHECDMEEDNDDQSENFEIAVSSASTASDGSTFEAQRRSSST